jgi:SAM-dependent methyltransferase
MRLEAALEGRGVVLELGSGSGTLWEHLKPSRRLLWLNLDADRRALRDAQSRSHGAVLINADAARLPLKDRSVDVIAGLTFFDAVHLEQLDPILAETRRVLKRGGRLVHLQDFPDWPGAEIAAQFNLLLDGLHQPRSVRFDEKRLRLLYPRLGPLDAARVQGGLSAAAARLEPVWRDRLFTLRRALREQDRLNPALADPRFAFNSILARSLARHGFQVLSRGRKLRGDLTYVSYLVARRID